MNVELLEFTRRALEKGEPRPRIAEVLRAAGWSEAEVRAALAAFAESDFPLAVPRPRPYLSAREVFVYALMFTALYVSAWHLGALVFQFINLGFPDAAQRAFRPGAIDAMRRDIAALVVAFPLFALLMRRVHLAMDRDSTRRDSRPRRWLTYLTLFIAAAALIGDVSALVYNALGGELTARFLLKVATVAAIAGGTFSYFLADIRKDETP